jgi:predicted HTH domain antitoxin
MQLTLNIPDFAPLTLNKDLAELKQTIKLNSALMLFKNSKFSIEQASRFANLSVYEFMNECKNNRIAVISYEENELENELKMLDNL